MPNKILVALSGGPDSVALLYFLKKQGFDVYAAHLNHKIRMGESKKDEFFVKGLCKKLNIPLIVGSIDVPYFAKKNKLSLEDAARRCRYDFLERTAIKFDTVLIALGHNADDNVETFLMNLIRGAGLKGLSGIPPLREIPITKKQDTDKLQITNYKLQIIRPLLNIWRKDILRYCKKHKLKYRVDKSNFDTKYFRNLIRHKVLPKIDKEKISALVKKIAAQYKWLTEIAKNSRLSIQPLPDIIKSHIIRGEIEKIKGNLVDIQSIHIKDILDHLENTEAWQLDLPDGVKVIWDRNTLKITKVPVGKPANFKYKLKIPGITEIQEIGAKINAVLDFNKTGKALYVRNWKAGDKFQPFGMKGTKKLSDYFVDQKISVEEKSKIPIIVNGKGQIVCVGNRIDERFKVDNATKKIINLL